MTSRWAGKRRKVAVSTGSQVIGQLVSAALAVFTLRILTQTLGVHDYGVYATAFAVVSTFALLADIGVTSITAREIARRPDEADEIIAVNMGLRIALCVAAWPIIVGVSFLLYGNDPTLHACVAIFAASIVFDGIRAVGLAYFAAVVRGEVAALVNLCQQVFMLGFSAWVAVETHDVVAFVCAYTLAHAIGAVITIAMCRRHHVRVRPRIDLGRWRAIFRMSASLGIIQIINLLYLKVDALIISVLQGAAAVGIYGVAYSLLQPALMAPMYLMSALIPSMSTAKDSQALSAIVQRAYRLVAAAAILLAVGGYAVRLFATVAVSSSEFVGAATPFAILCSAAMFSYLNNVFGFAATSIDKHHRFVIVSIAALVANVLLNFALIPHFGLVGAASATLASEALSFCGIVIVFRRDTGIHIQLVRPLVPALLAGAAALVVLHVLPCSDLGDNALTKLLLAGVQTVLVYVAVYVVATRAHDFMTRGRRRRAVQVSEERTVRR
jgi:O-antigen/teichoic acid export membrane protein